MAQNVISKFVYGIRSKLQAKDAARNQPAWTTKPAWLGDNAGSMSVLNGEKLPDGYVVVRDFDGVLSKAYNDKVPLKPGLGVIVGYDPLQPTRFKVLAIRDYMTDNPPNVLPYHHKSHEYPGSDTVFVHSEQYLPGLLMANNGLVISIYPFFFKKADGSRGYCEYQTLDLTAYLPATGAQALLLVVKDDETLEIIPGSTAISLASITPADFPSNTSATKHDLWGIRVYHGQTAIRQGQSNGWNDAFDFRAGGIQGGGGGEGGGVESVSGDGVDNTDPANPVVSYPTPGDIGAATDAQGSLADTAVQPGDLPIFGDIVTHNADEFQVAGSYLTSANIENAIHDGENGKAPSENAVFDALAGKATAVETTAENDFQVGNGADAWTKKTLAETKTILGIGAGTELESALAFIQLPNSKNTIYDSGTDIGKVDSILLCNSNTSNEVVELYLNDGTHEYKLFKTTLLPNETRHIPLEDGLIVDASSIITGNTTTASKVTCLVTGSIVPAGKNLAFVQLAAAKEDIYVPDGVNGKVTVLILHNTNTTDEVVVLYVHDGTDEYQIFRENIVADETVTFIPGVLGVPIADGWKITGNTTTASKVTCLILGGER
jgi:hypothetical protein